MLRENPSQAAQPVSGGDVKKANLSFLINAIEKNLHDELDSFFKRENAKEIINTFFPTTDRKIITPFIFAVLKNNLTVVEKLLLNGADINLPEKVNNVPPVYLACANKYYELAKFLIKQHSKIDKVPTNYDSMLNIAIDSEDNELFDLAMLTNLDVNPTSPLDLPPIIFAINRENSHAVSELIARKAKLNILYKNTSPIEYAAMSGNVEIGKLLLSSYPKFISQSQMALKLAVERGQSGFVRLLLDNGVRDTKSNQELNKGSALQLAAGTGNLNVVRAFLKSTKPEVPSSPGQLSLDSRTLLSLAAWGESVEVLKKVDDTVVDIDKNTMSDNMAKLVIEIQADSRMMSHSRAVANRYKFYATWFEYRKQFTEISDLSGFTNWTKKIESHIKKLEPMHLVISPGSLNPAVIATVNMIKNILSCFINTDALENNVVLMKLNEMQLNNYLNGLKIIKNLIDDSFKAAIKLSMLTEIKSEAEKANGNILRISKQVEEAISKRKTVASVVPVEKDSKRDESTSAKQSKEILASEVVTPVADVVPQIPQPPSYQDLLMLLHKERERRDALENKLVMAQEEAKKNIELIENTKREVKASATSLSAKKEKIKTLEMKITSDAKNNEQAKKIDAESKLKLEKRIIQLQSALATSEVVREEAMQLSQSARRMQLKQQEKREQYKAEQFKMERYKSGASKFFQLLQDQNHKLESKYTELDVMYQAKTQELVDAKFEAEKLRLQLFKQKTELERHTSDNAGVTKAGLSLFDAPVPGAVLIELTSIESKVADINDIASAQLENYIKVLKSMWSALSQQPKLFSKNIRLMAEIESKLFYREVDKNKTANLNGSNLFSALEYFNSALSYHVMQNDFNSIFSVLAEMNRLYSSAVKLKLYRPAFAMSAPYYLSQITKAERACDLERLRGICEVATVATNANFMSLDEIKLLEYDVKLQAHMALFRVNQDETVLAEIKDTILSMIHDLCKTRHNSRYEELMNVDSQLMKLFSNLELWHGLLKGETNEASGPKMKFG